jgi:hypothetical protein
MFFLPLWSYSIFSLCVKGSNLACVNRGQVRRELTVAVSTIDENLTEVSLSILFLWSLLKPFSYFVYD